MTDAPDWVPVETAVGATTAAVQQVDTDVLAVGTKVDAVKASTDTIQTKVDNVAAQVQTVQTNVADVKASTDAVQTKVDAVSTTVNALKGGWGTQALTRALVSVAADGALHTLIAAPAAGHAIVVVGGQVAWAVNLGGPNLAPRGYLDIDVSGGVARDRFTLTPEAPTQPMIVPPGGMQATAATALSALVNPVNDSAQQTVWFVLWYYLT